MKYVMFLFILLVSLSAKAVAPYGIKGQNQSGTLYSNVHQFPNNQVTNLGGINALVETGNKNILSNADFEAILPNTSWTTPSGVVSIETSVVISGKKSWLVSHSAEPVNTYQDSTLYQTQFADGVDGLVGIWIKTSVSGIKVCSRSAGTTSTTNCVDVSNNNKWAPYQVPTVLGATSNGIAVTSSGVNVTGDVYIDDAFLGAVDLKQDVDQSRIAGESYFAGTANCDWSRTSTTVGAFPVDTDCPGPTLNADSISMGSWQTTDSDLPRQTINNLPAGVYKAKFIVNTSMSTTANTALAINDGTTTCEPMGANQSSATQSSVVVECVFKYSSSGNRVFELYGGSASNSLNINNSATSPRRSVKFILEYFGNNQTYSASCGTNCVDTFSAKVSAAGVVSGENVDWINGNAVVTTNSYAITFRTGVFTVSPNCTATPLNNTNTATVQEFTAATSTGGTWNTVVGGSPVASEFRLICQKQGSDFTATRTITGSFKEVPTIPNMTKPKKCIVYFGGAGSASSPTVCTTGTCTEYYDNCGTASSVFNATGNYSTTWANGTWANSTIVTCGSSSGNGGNAFTNTTVQTPATNSSGGLLWQTVTLVGTTNTNAHVMNWCEGQAP